MGELEREHEEHARREESPYRLPPLPFAGGDLTTGTADTISPGGRINIDIETIDGTRAGAAGEATAMTVGGMSEDGVLFPSTTSHSSPVLPSSSLNWGLQTSALPSTSSTAGSSSSSTRPRSSSTSSDKTQRALKSRHGGTGLLISSSSSNSISTTSSASSVNSLTPLASPSAHGQQSAYSQDGTAAAGIVASFPTSADPSSSRSTSAPGVGDVQRRRHHYHYQPTIAAPNLHLEQRRRRSTSSSSAYLHGGRASHTTEQAHSRRTVYHPGLQRDTHTSDTTQSSRSRSLSLSSFSPPALDTVNTLGLSYDQHHSDFETVALCSSTASPARIPFSYSFVSLTSIDPLRPAHAAVTDVDEETRPGRHHLQQSSHAERSARPSVEQAATADTSITSPIRSGAPLSTSSSFTHQTFEPDDFHPLPERKNSWTAATEQASLTDPSCPSSSSSSSFNAGRPDLLYRIPSFNPSEPLRAALPESLAKLVILDSPPVVIVPLTAQTEQTQDSEHQQVALASPVDIVEDPNSAPSEDIASSEEIATPPYFRSHLHQAHATRHRLSSSLPASPTRATHAVPSEALAVSHSTSVRIPALRAGLDLFSSSRLPLTPLEETDTPDMRMDSPADLAEPSNPFDAFAFAEQLSKAGNELQDSLTDELKIEEANDADETFYHTLLELVNSESGYSADLKDLVDVHFSLLSIARFVTEEQRTIIVRDATHLVDLHRRLEEKLKRVDEDLGWIREDDSDQYTDESGAASPQDWDDASSISTDERSTPSTYTPSTPSRQQSYHSAVSTARSFSRRSTNRTRRFKSSDATVLDAARRISSIFINEAKNLSEAYEPFCSGHSEAMEVVKNLSTGTKTEWDAFEAQCTAHLASRRMKTSSSFSSSSSRLHFADFLIKPVQRICRYPLLFGSLLKNAQRTTLASVHQDLELDDPQITITHVSLSGTAPEVGKSIERIREALHTSKVVASGVDHAQKMRSLEVATVKLARRIEVQNQDHVSLLNRLEQVLLVGSAHVIYAHAPTLALQGLPSIVKAGFYGLVLYNSHLVFFKVKKTNVYEPRHWLPLRSFDLHKVVDGEGTLPYAFRMTCGDHTFEVGSLCHSEQNIWVEAIEQATSACRAKWLENVANDTAAMDESPVCSLQLDSSSANPAMYDGVSPIMPSSEFGVFPTSPEAPKPSTSRATSFLSLRDEAVSGANPGFRSRLSLKPPAQRVGVDLRLADLLSDSILSARAQSKRSHAMPLHGPPPRSLTAPQGVPQIHNKRPHSFHPASFSYRNIIDSTLSSRRTSLAESDGSRSSTGMKQLFHPSASSANLSSLSQTEGSDTLRRKPTKLRRSRTSAQMSDQEATDTTTTPQRSNSTLGKLRRRATSLVSDSGAMKALEEIQMQEQVEQYPVPKAAIVTVSTQTGPIAIAVVPEQAILDASVQATVARNSSTSSSSSYASTSTDPSLGTSLETPQSSLPASPLLTPVDLETHSRWTKIGDALSYTLMRKRSFASQRPILSIPPEALLSGTQLEQAQNAAEFIYTGRNACGSNCSHGSGNRSAATSSHSYERRYSWDKVGWNTLTAPGQTQRNSLAGHQRSTSGVSAPPSMSGGAGSQPNIFGGRSAPNLSAMADKRQASSGSLWSVFERNGDFHSASRASSSPAPSVYEEAPESEESSAYPSPSGQYVPLPDIAEMSGRAMSEEPQAQAGSFREGEVDAAVTALCIIPVTRINPLGGSTAPSLPMVSPAESTSSSSALPSPSSYPDPAAPDAANAPGPFRTGSLMKRKNSLSARLRAFKALGSGMTPVRQQQPSRSYLTRS